MARAGGLDAFSPSAKPLVSTFLCCHDPWLSLAHTKIHCISLHLALASATCSRESLAADCGLVAGFSPEQQGRLLCLSCLSVRFRSKDGVDVVVVAVDFDVVTFGLIILSCVLTALCCPPKGCPGPSRFCFM